MTEAQRRASAKYDREHTKIVSVKLNRKTDADVIEKLESVPNKSGYIKRLVRKDIGGSHVRKD